MQLIYTRRSNNINKKPSASNDFKTMERRNMKEQQFKNDWKSQEDAFFGNVSTNASNLGRENSATRRDFELATRLQNEIDLEDRAKEENDLEYARMVQSQEEEEYVAHRSNDTISGADHANRLDRQQQISNSPSDNGLVNTEGMNDEDLEMALIMQNLESLGKGQFIYSHGGENVSLDTMRKLLKIAQEDSAQEETKVEDTTIINDELHKKQPATKHGDKKNNFRKGLGTLLRRKGTDNTPHIQAPICSVCNESAISYLRALGKIFHPSCFRCVGCNEPIPSGEPFAYKQSDDGEKFPLHRRCHSMLYGMKCTVCFESIPYAEDGSVSFVKHPFFTSERMCPNHTNDQIRRCTACNRFEPIGYGFVDLYDKDRCVCHACCRTVIVDSEDAKPLYKSVMDFFEHQLDLPIWDGMHDIPVLIVASDTLNSSSEHSGHRHSDQILTRGLCLSEHQCGRRIALQRLTYDKHNSSFRSKDGKKNGFFEVPDIANASSNASVTAILCLTGLPKDLTASILAHEATHAWLKLHPHFSASQPIPLQVEEGVCQLVAFLYLNDGLAPPSTVEEDGLSDQKLRQYFKFSIEADENEVYGEGFRIAANCYAAIGIYELLNHIAVHRAFPQL